MYLHVQHNTVQEAKEWCHDATSRKTLLSSLDGRGIRTDPESQSRLSFKPFLRFKVFPNLRRHRRHVFLKRGNIFFQSRKKHPLALPMCWLSSFLPKMSRTSAFTILADTGTKWVQRKALPKCLRFGAFCVPSILTIQNPDKKLSFGAKGLTWNQHLHWRLTFCSDRGLSENSVPLHPMVNDHYPY